MAWKPGSYSTWKPTPFETDNLIDDPAKADLVARLKADLKACQAQFNDPALHEIS